MTMAASAQAYLNFAQTLQKQGYLPATHHAYEQAYQRAPNDVAVIVQFAYFLKQIGQLTAATTLLHTGLQQFPTDPDLLWLAARLDYRQNNHVRALQQLEQLLQQPLPAGLQRRSLLQLGLLHDRLGEFPQAFQKFAQANQVADQLAQAQGIRPEVLWDGLGLTDERILCPQWVDQWLGRWDKTFLESDKKQAPIFVVGFHRSGTTLVGEILNSHPALQTLVERPVLSTLLEELKTDALKTDVTESYLDRLHDMDEAALHQLRSLYYQKVTRLLKLAASQRLVDKFIFNIMYIPLIKRLFPNAQFILVLRHPYAACLSCFMQNFTLNPLTVHFTSLETTAQLYTQIMGFWQQAAVVYKLDVHIVRYEQVVTNFTHEIGRLFDFLALPWHPALHTFYLQAQQNWQIHPPSHAQVSQPLYEDSIERWQRYRANLQPLHEPLQPFVAQFGYTT